MRRPPFEDIDRDAVLALVLIALLVLAAPAGYVIAASLTHESTSGVTYQTNDGLTVTLTTDRTVEASPFANDATFADGPLRVSSTGAAEIGVGDPTYDVDVITVQQVDATNPITVERTDLERDFVIESGDLNTLQMRDYAVDNDTEDFAYSSDGGFTVTLDGLPSVGVAAVDTQTGDVLDSDNVQTTGGDATLSLPAGTYSIELQSVPSELQVRNEAQPDELIDGEGVELRARFFGEEETVVEREVVDGTVDLDGLPADEELVVTVKEANADFTYRRILLNNIVETREIYLLPTTEPSAEIRFQLNDQTGRFDAEETRFFVEKPITREGETEYRVISGDRLGADQQFPTVLIDSERYRLRVQNDAGEQRVLGSYTVQGAEVAVIPIGDVEFTGEADGDPAMQASLREAHEDATHNHEVRITYVDPQAETDELEISITDSQGAEIRPTTTETLAGETDIYVETYPLDASFDPEADTATVTVTATRGLETEEFTRTVGDIPDIFTDAPIDPAILELMGYVSIVALVGLLVIVSPPMAALVGAGYAGLLTLVGVVSIPMPGVVLAGLVGILAVVGTRRGLFG